ncbi:MAG: alpha-L-fucosidase [Planctomycetota bacterium]|jgi:alpha-L-fucosidase
MKRRDFLKATVAAGASLAAPNLAGAADESARAETEIATPLPKQVRWQDYELGLVYHFDLDVYMPGGHHHERSRRERLDPALYHPDELDTDQWLAAAQAAGARYAIFTATHHQGFLQWQSDLYPFGLKQVQWRGGKADIVRDFVESCHKVGIAPGLYIGIRFNAYWQVYNYQVNGGKGGDAERHARYMRLCERMVEELCSRYGPLCEIWFDGGVLTPEQGGPDVLPIVQKHQPDAIFYHSLQCAQHRWAGNEQGTAGYPCWSTMPSVGSQIRAHQDQKQRTTLLPHGDPNGKVWCPSMADAPIREHDWLWIPNADERLQPLDKLLNMYYKSVGHNANLILGAVPNADGLIPSADFDRYAEMGREIRCRFATPLARVAGKGVSLELALPKPAGIDHVAIMEDIAHGERVRKYAVEGLVSPDEWQPLCDGISIGHKRIQQFDAVEVAKVRLRVTESVAEPVVCQLAVYSTA